MFSCLQEASEIYSVAELRILSNWGHLEYTCVYRFRVHGEPSFVWEEDHLKGFFSFGLFYATTENVKLKCTGLLKNDSGSFLMYEYQKTHKRTEMFDWYQNEDCLP